jgi:energy-coupling factor transporter ATP-binding protein EcfA2
MTSPSAAVTSVKFLGVKGLRNFSLSLASMNILVGPNNAGKSTIIGAFRVLDAGLRRARAQSPERFGPNLGSRAGYRIPAESIPISMENIHTDYADVESTVTFRISNGNELELVFPRDGGCVMFTGRQSKQVRRPTEFVAAYPLRLGVVPVLGPVEHEEELVQEETVRRGLSTHRASRHFRSYWMYRMQTQHGLTNPDGVAAFDRLATLVRETWPGMDLEPPYQPSLGERNLAMFCKEERIPRELYWAGSGFQVWCQLLSHLLRAEGADLLVIDEPEIYLHPNLQRQLIHLLRALDSDVLIATHSTDVINEAEPSEILLVDKTKRSARRVVEPAGVRVALDIIGASRSVVVTQMARTGRALLVEGDDFEVLKRWAGTLGLRDIATSFTVTPVSLGGFPTYERVRSICEGLRQGLGKDLAVAILVDRDYRPVDEVNALRQEFQRHVDLVAILRRKELENYLLEVGPLTRAIARRVRDRQRRTGTGRAVSEPAVAGRLEDAKSMLRREAEAQAIARRIQFLRRSGANETTAAIQAMADFESDWTQTDGPTALIPGKAALARLNSWAQEDLDVSVSPGQIASEFRPEEIPAELKTFLRQLSELKRSAD